jgi:hypothetical protein
MISRVRIRGLVLGVFGALAFVTAFHLPVIAAEFDRQAEIAAAVQALDDAHQKLGGMGGLGAIPEPDLQLIHDLLSAAERLIREARLRAQDASTPQDDAWIVAHARAGLAMANAADEYRSNRGY